MILNLINQERHNHGSKGLVIDNKLRDLARSYDTDMFRRGYFSHYNPEGESPFDRMQKNGIEYLQAGEKFENLARTFSICPSKKRGGNLGEFSKGDMVPEFWNASIKLKIGEISQPVKSRFGYHIIKRIS